MIDEQGYRANVGIVLINPEQQVFWAERVRNPDAWQFPQGGVNEGETAEQAMYRELHEEVGLHASDVKMLAQTQDWLIYNLPLEYRRLNSEPVCVGQRQKWFLLELISSEANIDLDVCNPAEFASWRWVDYWHPVDRVISFKRDVYQQVLQEFSQRVFA